MKSAGWATVSHVEKHAPVSQVKQVTLFCRCWGGEQLQNHEIKTSLIFPLGFER
jgi:hypothetical protein